MNKSMSHKLVENALIAIPMAFVMVAIAQILMIGGVNWGLFLQDYLIAFALAVLFGVVLPLPMLGVFLAKKLNLVPGSMAFRLVVTLVVSFFLTLLMTFSMVFLNVIIFQGLPLPVFFSSWGKVFLPSWPASFVMALLLNPASQKAAGRIVGATTKDSQES